MHIVVNLIVQALLAALNEADDPEKDDYYIPNKHLPFHYDPDDDDEVQEMEAEGNNQTMRMRSSRAIERAGLRTEELDNEVTAKV